MIYIPTKALARIGDADGLGSAHTRGILDNAHLHCWRQLQGQMCRTAILALSSDGDDARFHTWSFQKWCVFNFCTVCWIWVVIMVFSHGLFKWCVLLIFCPHLRCTRAGMDKADAKTDVIPVSKLLEFHGLCLQALNVPKGNYLDNRHESINSPSVIPFRTLKGKTYGGFHK